MALSIKTSPRVRAACACLALTALAADRAAAQSMSANSAGFNSGYGRIAGSENRAVALAGARGAGGNRTIIDGIIQTGAATVSARAAAQASGAAAAGVAGGVGARGSGTAVGNSLTVITQGNYNTVIVNSTQTNTGYISANVSGGVGQ